MKPRAITVEAVETDADLRAFLRFPEHLYRQDPLWVAPILRDQRALLSPANPFFNHAETRLFSARREGEIVGRVAAIVDYQHVERKGERIGFFGFFESMLDQEATSFLLETTRAWLRSKGMATLRGPVSPSTNHECGLLVEGFDHPPRLLMPYNPPYYSALLEGAGLRQAKDLLSYDVALPEAFPDWLARIARMAEIHGCRVRTLDPMALKDEARVIRLVYNGAWRENWGFVPMTEAEAAYMTNRLRPFLVPELALIAECKGQTVGFMFSLPDYNPALRLLRGHITPWGILRFLWRRRSLDEMRVLAFGILPGQRRRGIDALLLRATYEAARRRRYRCAELSWILEDNVVMRRTVERLGAKVVKRYCLYEAPL